MGEFDQLKSLEDDFISFLVNKASYPQDSLVRECPLTFSKGSAYYLDLVVIDPQDSKVLSLFEFKSKIDESTKQILAATYRELITNLDASVPAFIVVPSSSDPKSFDVFHLIGDKRWQKIPPDTIPTFKALKSAEKAKARLRSEKKTKATLDRFRLICYLLVAILIIIIVLSFLGKVKVNGEQLVLIGIACALAVVPHAAKLKFLGIEFERMRPENKEKDIEK